MTKENFNLKQTYVKMPSRAGQAFKALIMEKCEWNPTIWFNKIHGKTPIAKLEENTIISIYTKIQNILNDDAN